MICGLKKLKDDDIERNNFENISYIYSGISQVTFDIDKTTQNTTVQQFLERYFIENKENIKANDFLALDTFTSTSKNADTARQFSEKENENLSTKEENNGENHGIILRINFPKLLLDNRIPCGDIGWISAHRNEEEICVAPCMVWIHKLVADDNKHCIKGKRKNTKVYHAEFRPLKNPSMLIKRLKEEILKENWNSGYHRMNYVNCDSIIDEMKINVNELSDGEKEVYDCIKNAVPKESDRYFYILKEQDCLNKLDLKDLTQADLQQIGIEKMGHLKSLLREFKNL